MSIHQRLAEWSAWGWPLLADHLWQATLVALLAFAAARLMRRSAARARYAIWLVACAKFAIPSALVIFLAGRAGLGLPSLFDSTAEAAQSVTMIRQVAAPALLLAQPILTEGESARGHNEIYCAMTIAWSAGCSALLFFWLRRRLRFARAMKSGRRVGHGREAEALSRARSRLGIKRPIQLVITPRLIEPGVWRTCRPIVVFPEGLSGHLNTPELEAVMLHEAVHVARWDNLINSAQMILCSLLWFHPLVWIVDRKLLAESENVCDEKVLALVGSSRVYASSLLKVLRCCMGCKVAGVSYATGSNLRRRVEQIMGENSNKRLAMSHRVLVAAIVAAAVMFSIAAGVPSRAGVVAQGKRGKIIIPGSPTGGIPGGVPGGVTGGVPGGVPDGVQTGVQGRPYRNVWGDVPPPPPPPPPPSSPPPPKSVPPPPPPPDLSMSPNEVEAPPPPHSTSLPGGPGLVGPAYAGQPAPPAEGLHAMPHPMHIEEGVEPPVMLNEVAPEYTERALKNNTEGYVYLRALVDKSGAVKSVRIDQGLPDGLNQSAEKAVRRLRFKPATKNGEPVELWVPLVVEFNND